MKNKCFREYDIVWTIAKKEAIEVGIKRPTIT